MKLFSIKDTKIGFMTPFQHHNESTAIRDVANAVNSPEINAANENLQDKELWLLGTFNEVTGQITSDVRHICKHIDLKKGVITNVDKQGNGGSSEIPQ